MNTVVKVRVNSEVVLRSVRRIHRKTDGLEYGWCSVGGKDVKVRREKRKLIWSLVS